MTSKPEKLENQKTTKLYMNIIKELAKGKKFSVINYRDVVTKGRKDAFCLTDQKIEDIFLCGPGDYHGSYIKFSGGTIIDFESFAGLMIYPEEKVVSFVYQAYEEHQMCYNISLQDREKESNEPWEEAKKQIEETEIYY